MKPTRTNKKKLKKQYEGQNFTSTLHSTKNILHGITLSSIYETWILQPIAYRIPGYVSDTDTHWIHLGYVSVEYPEKNKCR
jgi:hypothetical protein